VKVKIELNKAYLCMFDVVFDGGGKGKRKAIAVVVVVGVKGRGWRLWLLSNEVGGSR
jgi:hypothetical protein